MKIEKISENQIRCTLNKEDLFDRELKISELAYGTEKAKALFRDMMQQASYEFGFEAEDTPLMIEAIPLSGEGLVLVITKVEDPDELDTRFSKFSSDNEEDDNYYSDNNEGNAYADEIINCFGDLENLLDTTLPAEESENFIPLEKAITNKISDDKAPQKSAKQSNTQVNLTRVYSFYKLDDVIRLANVLFLTYRGENSLFKNTSSGKYYLVIHKSEHTPEEFNKVCNVISEYGKQERATHASYAYYEEHFEKIVKNDAVKILSDM